MLKGSACAALSGWAARVLLGHFSAAHQGAAEVCWEERAEARVSVAVLCHPVQVNGGCS